MGTDDFFKNKRHERISRSIENRNFNPVSYIIFTEGKETEVIYLTPFETINKNKKIIIEGTGFNTVSLVNYAERFLNRSSSIYMNVWIIFDKDDFKDFDKAIRLAKKKGYNVGWSNECFELWLYIHFNYTESALNRDQWCDKLSHILKENGKAEKYEKSDPNIFKYLEDKVKVAIRNAKKLHKNYTTKTPSKMNPCTTVYQLIEELIST